jgi:hypothetical protein
MGKETKYIRRLPPAQRPCRTAVHCLPAAPLGAHPERFPRAQIDLQLQLQRSTYLPGVQAL